MLSDCREVQNDETVISNSAQRVSPSHENRKDQQMRVQAARAAELRNGAGRHENRKDWQVRVRV